MHFQYATLTICIVTATPPTTTPRPVHMAGRSVPITAAYTNEEQQLFMLLAALAPSPPRTTARRNATRGRAPVHFQVCSPYAFHRQHQNHHQTEEWGGSGTFSATLLSLGFEPSSAGLKRGMLPTVLRQDTTAGHGATLTHCPSTVLMQHQ